MANMNVFLLSVVVIASLSSLSHGLILNGLPIAALEVTGVLRCSVDATDLLAPPVPSQIVILNCGGLSTNVGQAVTDPSGAFRIVVNVLDALLFTPSTCHVTVKLPLVTCSVFSPTGVLSAPISLVNVVHSTFGNVANFATGSFLQALL